MTHPTNTKSGFWTKIPYYWKGIVGALPFLFSVAFAVWGPDNKWVVVAVALAAAIGVYRVPNKKQPEES